MEQNTDEHELSRCRLVIACPVGWRSERPEFGWRFPTFRGAPLDTTSLAYALHQFAGVVVESVDEYADVADAAVRHMRVYIQETGG